MAAMSASQPRSEEQLIELLNRAQTQRYDDQRSAAAPPLNLDMSPSLPRSSSSKSLHRSGSGRSLRSQGAKSMLGGGGLVGNSLSGPHTPGSATSSIFRRRERILQDRPASSATTARQFALYYSESSSRGVLGESSMWEGAAENGAPPRSLVFSPPFLSRFSHVFLTHR
jgi:hypothetical protein